MGKLALTDLTIQRLKEGMWWDTNLPAFGIRVGKHRKTFLVRIGRERREVTLGHYPTLSLKDARSLAKTQTTETTHKGVNPPQNAILGFLEACGLATRPSTLRVYRHYLDLFDLSTLPPSKKHIEEVLSTLNPPSANLAHATLRTFLNWCLEQEYITTHPLIRSKAPHRLILIDPADTITHPIGLNLFYTESVADPIEQERRMNAVVETLDFVFSSIMSSALTDKQSVLMRYAIRYLLATPRSTIYSLIDLLEHGPGSTDHLPETAQRFFASAWTGKKNEYDETKGQILRRLYTLLENPVVANLFASPEARFRIGKEMDAGKIILISTDKGLLKSTGTAFFGRFFLSQIAQAMQEREENRTPTFVYIDEVGDYLNSEDANIKDILEKGRKYKVDITMAHQQISQLPGNVYQSILTNTATKYVGRVSAGDFRALKDNIHAETQARKRYAFLMHNRDIANHAIEVMPTAGIFENAPKHSTRDMERFMAENRARYGVSLHTRKPLPQTLDDDDIERFNQT